MLFLPLAREFQGTDRRKINMDQIVSEKARTPRKRCLGRILSAAIALIASAQLACAQYQSEHPIEVERLTNWAPDYLTVTNNWNNLCISPQTPTLKCLSVVTAINGQSTKDMDEEEFYSLLDLGDSFTLTYLTKANGTNKEYTKTFTKRKGRLLITPFTPKSKATTISLLADSDVDFFKFSTFDYRLAGDDQLMDKTIMEVFADHLRDKGLKRVEDDPDIYLYVTKDVNQKIESIYVPKYTTTTETGDAGIGIANIFGLKGVNVGGSSGSATTTTQETGSMRTNVTADAYLEFSILDASKLDKSAAPIIWQLTYSEHRTSEIRLLDAVKEWIGGYMLQYPFHENYIGSHAATWGLFCENFATEPVVSDIAPGTKAEQLGCEVGDEIKYVRYLDNGSETCTFRPGQSFYGSNIIPTTKMMQVGKKKISKGGLTEIISYTFINKN